MRRSAVLLFAVVFAAACTPNHKPYQSATPTPAPTEAAVPYSTSTPEASAGAAATVAPGDFAADGSFAPSGQGFSIAMPGTPTATSQTVKTPGGNMTMTTWTYTDPSGVEFAVSRSSFAKGALGKTSAKTVYDTAAPMVAQQSGGKLSSQSDVAISGHPGRKLEISTATANMSGVMVLVGDDLYMPYVGAPTGKAPQTAIDAYLASLKTTA
jgi:hypothetical protein